MAHRLIWSGQAADDLIEVVEFISRDSPRYAAAVAQRIISACEHLIDMPLASAIVPELALAEIRQVIVRPYRIVFRVTDSQVQIVAVMHGARDVGRILRDRG